MFHLTCGNHVEILNCHFLRNFELQLLRTFSFVFFFFWVKVAVVLGACLFPNTMWGDSLSPFPKWLKMGYVEYKGIGDILVYIEERES